MNWVRHGGSRHMSMASPAILSNFLEKQWTQKQPTIPFGVVACTLSDNLSQNSCIWETHKKETPIKIVTVERKRLSNQCKYTQQRQTEQRKTTAEGLAQPKNTQRFIAAQNEHTPDALPQSKNLQQRVFAETNDTEERLHEWSDYEQRLPFTFASSPLWT